MNKKTPSTVAELSEAPMRILRVKEVQSITGLKPEAIYRLGREGKFPRAIKISEFSSGWVESEVQNYMLKRLQMRDETMRS